MEEVKGGRKERKKQHENWRAQSYGKDSILYLTMGSCSW